MLSKQEFETILTNLPRQRKDILFRLLRGETDKQIATALAIHQGTVRKQISNLALDFGLGNDGKQKRTDLVALVAKHQPELLFQKAPSIDLNNLTNQHSLMNPFFPVNGIIDDSQFVYGRDKDLKEIFNYLNCYSSVSIVGDRGIGKSSLLKVICEQSKTRLYQYREPIYLNLQNINNEDEFYEAFCDLNGIKYCKGYELYRNLKNYRLLLVIDEIERIYEDCFTDRIQGQLRVLAEGMNAPLKLVLASATPLDELFSNKEKRILTSPLEGICIQHKLDKWSQEVARGFINNRLDLSGTNITFTDDEICELINTSEGHPQKLMILCYQLFQKKRNALDV